MMSKTVWLIDDGQSHYSDHTLTGFSLWADADAYMKRHFSSNQNACIMQVIVDPTKSLAELHQPVSEWVVRAMGAASNWLEDEYNKEIDYAAFPITIDETYYDEAEHWPNGIPNRTTPVTTEPMRSTANREMHLRVPGATKQEAIDTARPILEPAMTIAIRQDIEAMIDQLRKGLA